MKVSLLIFIFAWTLSGCGTEVPDSFKFKIVIENHYYGHTRYRTTVTQDSLIIFKDDFNGDTTVTRRALTEKESNSLSRFLMDYPLDKLRDSYVHPSVEDGLMMSVYITVNDKQKNVYVQNYYVETLGELIEKVLDLLPEKYFCYDDRYMDVYRE
ncbi:MAG: hypothetical protein ABIJ16_01585 [Bacteroidota bacterium]